MKIPINKTNIALLKRGNLVQTSYDNSDIVSKYSLRNWSDKKFHLDTDISFET